MLPEILLDDVRFQELVSEARTRIVRYSPEWTEHNVSDPGITLIELFAWLTELLVYRINRIPERLHFALLALVGVHPAPPECATVAARFICRTRPRSGRPRGHGDRLASHRRQRIGRVPDHRGAGHTRGLRARGLRNPARGRRTADHRGEGKAAHPAGPEQAAFATPSADGDALLLGFRSSPAGLVIRLTFDAREPMVAALIPPTRRWSGRHPADGSGCRRPSSPTRPAGFCLGSGDRHGGDPPRSRGVRARRDGPPLASLSCGRRRRGPGAPARRRRSAPSAPRSPAPRSNACHAPRY